MLKGAKSFIYKADIFYTAQLLRYKDEPEYRTLFGGMLSLGLIIAMITIFYSKVIDTLNKVIITANGANNNAADPLPFTFDTFPGSKFMFGVQVWHHDLNNNTRYFDIVLRNTQLNTGVQIENVTNTRVIPLQPCTMNHWDGFPKIQADFERLNMSYWKCLPKNQQFTIQGKYASVISRTLQVAVKRCTDQSDPDHPCADSAIVQQFLKSDQFFTIYFINPLLNPSSQVYLTHYLQDNNYIIFSQSFGSEGILFMEQYNIETDQSILPFNDIKKQNGGLVSTYALKNPYAINNQTQTYCFFSFFKSGMTRSYQRTFQKIDQILSYIGGLFGTITICLALVNVYNSYSFQLSLGGYLFRSKSNLEHKFKEYNFFSFISHLFYAFLQIFNIQLNCNLPQEYYNCREEMLKQLDIFYLIQRVLFLQKAIGSVLNDHQLIGLHLQSKLTLEDASKKRKKFKIKNKVLKQCRKNKERDTKEQQQIFNTTQNFIIYPDQRKSRGKMQQDQSPGGISQPQKIIQQRSSLSLKTSNKIAPLSEQNSDSESSCSEQQNNTEEGKYLIQQLHKLKRQSDEGIIVSKLIWNGLDTQVKKHMTVVRMQSEADIHEQLFQQADRQAKLKYQSKYQNYQTNQIKIINRQNAMSNQLKLSETECKPKSNWTPFFHELPPKQYNQNAWSWQQKKEEENDDPLHVQFNVIE